MKKLFVWIATLLLGLATSGCAERQSREPFFVQISDPQLGFINESADFSPEVALVERIAGEVNSLRPDFVVFSGDLVQWRTDQAALDAFKQLTTLFDQQIPLYFVPGNHDVGNTAEPDEVARFEERYGASHFVWEGEGYTAIGYNSCVIKAQTEGEQSEYEWLRARLTEASERGCPIIMVAHHPLFVHSNDEADSGENTPLAVRQKYLDLFAEFDVELVLSGHLHRSAAGEYEGVRLQTISAAGRPLGECGSGIGVVTISEGAVEVEFREVGDK